ncbi:hypothetical protein CBM2623_A240122 [Cupriavidus taiwanensis]|nr:hypothetical protein CBM2608_A240121 [Cupriavidus taiwanensis]SPA27731.1 hypothetical protein CBM2623_A240122 [Cupriavidus taiwanensis]
MRVRLKPVRRALPDFLALGRNCEGFLPSPIYGRGAGERAGVPTKSGVTLLASAGPLPRPLSRTRERGANQRHQRAVKNITPCRDFQHGVFLSES